MGDSNGSSVSRFLVGQPIRNTPHNIKNGLTAVRRGCGIVQPGISGVRFILDNLPKSLSGPAPVVALTQHRLNVCAQSKCFGGLSGPQFGTGPTAIDARQASDELSGSRFAVVVERFVPRKRR
jgi:hypothetical protein